MIFHQSHYDQTFYSKISGVKTLSRTETVRPIKTSRLVRILMSRRFTPITIMGGMSRRHYVFTLIRRLTNDVQDCLIHECVFFNPYFITRPFPVSDLHLSDISFILSDMINYSTCYTLPNLFNNSTGPYHQV